MDTNQHCDCGEGGGGRRGWGRKRKGCSGRGEEMEEDNDDGGGVDRGGEEKLSRYEARQKMTRLGEEG